MPYVLAMDKGTSVAKCVLFDENGRELAVARRPTRTCQPKPGWHEEDTEQVWQDLAGLCRQVVKESGVSGAEVATIGVTAHMAGLILLDGELRPVYPSVLWDDARAAPIVEQWRASSRLDAFFQVGGQALLSGLTVPLVRWFAVHQLEVLARARHLCTTKDYLVLKMTGQLGTDESDAGWMPGNVADRGHSPEIRRLAGIEEYSDLFPEVRRSEEVVGRLTRKAARELNLHQGIPVVAGLGDASASTVGVGAVLPGQAASIIGTSLLNNIVVDRPVMEPLGIGFVLPTVGGRWLRMLPNTGGGSVNLKWFVELAYWGSDDPYAEMDREVATQPVGAGGVLYHPYINNAGVVAPFYNLGARAQFTGLHVGASRAAVARAVYEGIALSILDCYGSTPVDVTEVRLSGGAARSPVLCQVVADVLGKPVLVPRGEEAAARGAAMAAGWGIGMYPSLEDAASRCVVVGSRYEPDMKNHGLYQKRYRRFREVREEMMDVWNRGLGLDQ